MKTSFLILLITFSFNGFCMNEVLVTYFDPFDGKEINNSEVVAKELKSTFKSQNIKLTLCKLRTVFDKAFDDVQDCIASLESKPIMVISIGEAGCYGVKIETRALNYDKSFSPDNDGIDRYGSEIYKEEAHALGVTLPVEKAYCALSPSQKKLVFISKNAGSFVCNNTLYHMLRNLSIPSTFVHVSTKKCNKRKNDTTKMSNIIGDMISAMGKESLSIEMQQPASKEEVKLTLQSELSSCEKSFYQILKKEY